MKVQREQVKLTNKQIYNFLNTRTKRTEVEKEELLI